MLGLDYGEYYAELSDYGVSLAVCIGITVVRLVIGKAVFTPAAEYVWGVKDKVSQAKFCDAAFKLLIWSACVCIGLITCWDKPWFLDSIRFWDYYPTPMTFDVRAYYLFELGWYFHQMLFLIVFESDTGKKRSDAIPMLIHHLATIGLISFSYLNGFSPVGCMIMLVHDIVDVPLEAALLTKEMGYDTLTDILFVNFPLLAHLPPRHLPLPPRPLGRLRARRPLAANRGPPGCRQAHLHLPALLLVPHPDAHVP
ncbi:Trh1 protein [Thecamonas trahens ATCC 50062]|uniref:Trh1 protein n=1 Tax=Thecamonas trahens ATCC 50062 TaxID=461836 RepID=A0A0L0DPZ3_THETB|nr:Trh1 protein [Thecamonas trahens ATCC 50062]KNC54379.1 Trh1 protein [Thecamonas trahens ATCC 50062]|eukprot:XP_013753679.1 Trh1 protein [Thecamonas trahens ATCC 50062]